MKYEGAGVTNDRRVPTETLRHGGIRTLSNTLYNVSHHVKDSSSRESMGVTHGKCPQGPTLLEFYVGRPMDVPWDTVDVQFWTWGVHWPSREMSHVYGR